MIERVEEPTPPEPEEIRQAADDCNCPCACSCATGDQSTAQSTVKRTDLQANQFNPGGG